MRKYRYQLRVSYARGPRHRADLGFDDFTLAPECFGIGVPEEEKSEKLCPDPPSAQGTDYPYHDSTTYIPYRRDNVWKVGTCDAQGREGPSVEQCTAYYQPPDFREPLPIVRPPSQSLPGYQTWMVPWDGYYMLIAKGASGGSGVQTQGLKTRGGVAKGGFYFKRDTSIHVLVGHEGVSACADVMCGHLPCSVDTCPAVWTPALQCGHLPCSVDTCPAVWTPALQCGHLPCSVDTCPEVWTPALKCGHLPCSVDTCPAVWTPALQCGHLP
ncbi:hypothetical protein FHG87_000975 [Trinorchestia longiramus]|nr:hypothetical protein FHG87_000975 [Trinorchestia longiramus]